MEGFVCIMSSCLFPKWSLLFLLLAEELSLRWIPCLWHRAWGMSHPLLPRTKRLVWAWHRCGHLCSWLSYRTDCGLGSHLTLLGRSSGLVFTCASSPQSSEAGRHPPVRVPALCSHRWRALGCQLPSSASLVLGRPRASRWEHRRQVR